MKTLKALTLSAAMSALMLSPLTMNAQYDEDKFGLQPWLRSGLLGKGENVDASPSRGIMDRGTTGSGITLQGFGENQNNLTLQNFGEEAPLGSRWLILMGAGLGYAALKQKKTTKSKQNK